MKKFLGILREDDFWVLRMLMLVSSYLPLVVIANSFPAKLLFLFAIVIPPVSLILNLALALNGKRGADILLVILSLPSCMCSLFWLELGF